VAFELKVVVQAGVNGGELLQCLHLPETLHGSFSSPEGQVAVFRCYGANATNRLRPPVVAGTQFALQVPDAALPPLQPVLSG
jgi:hypothetical protein